MHAAYRLAVATEEQMARQSIMEDAKAEIAVARAALREAEALDVRALAVVQAAASDATIIAKAAAPALVARVAAIRSAMTGSVPPDLLDAVGRRLTLAADLSAIFAGLPVANPAMSLAVRIDAEIARVKALPETVAAALGFAAACEKAMAKPAANPADRNPWMTDAQATSLAAAATGLAAGDFAKLAALDSAAAALEKKRLRGEDSAAELAAWIAAALPAVLSEKIDVCFARLPQAWLADFSRLTDHGNGLGAVAAHALGEPAISAVVTASFNRVKAEHAKHDARLKAGQDEARAAARLAAQAVLAGQRRAVLGGLGLIPVATP